MSISSSLQKDKFRYYSELKKAQRRLEITGWMIYFIEILNDALLDSKLIAVFTLKKTVFFHRYKNLLSERESKAINKMFEAGHEGFKGGMTAKKYISINKTSKATATRDLQYLSEIGVLKMQGGGRSVSYILNLD